MTQTAIQRLNGLVLAGGESTRMGSDKGVIAYHGAPQVCHLLKLLARYCERVLVSINPAQRDRQPYADLPVIVDALPRRGPASGLLAAYELEPTAAWLVAAVDLGALTGETLDALVRARQSSAAATVFRHADGTLEPLCAIWESAACVALAARVVAGDTAPRRCLESLDIKVAVCPDVSALRSLDTPVESEKFRHHG